MIEKNNKNNSIDSMNSFKKDLIETLNKIHILYWEWNSFTDIISFHTDSNDKKTSSFNSLRIKKAEFINLFASKFRDDVSNLFTKYTEGKINSHRILCEFEFLLDGFHPVLNFGFSILDNNQILVRGILLRIASDVGENNQLDELKIILKHISVYTDEEFWIRDLNFNLLFISKPYSAIYDYTAEELIQTPLEKIFTPESIYYIQHSIEEEIKFQKGRKSLTDKNLVFTLKGFKKNGNQIWTENSLNFIKDNQENIIGIWGISRNITERIRTDQVKEALYKISEYSHLSDDLNDFFAEIHSIIKAIMPANNFCICLYNKENDIISCPYKVDTKQQNFSNGLAHYLIKSEKSLFLDCKSIEKLIEENKIDSLNPIPHQWIGILLKVKNDIKGGLIVYSYKTNEQYNQDDFENLKFVADQTSMVIERKIIETEKHKIKSLLEAVSKSQSILLTRHDIYLAIQQAFNQIGQTINVCRIALYENNFDALNNTTYAKLIIEWTSKREYEGGSLKRIDFAPNLLRWLNQFQLANIIKDTINTLSLAEYEIFKSTKAKSILCIPIFISKKLWGFIKFDDCKTERTWTEQEISVLSVVAASIGGIYQRKISEETLKTSEEKYRNFINNSMEGISLLQFTEPIDINLPIEEQIDKMYETGFIAEANNSLAMMYGLSSQKDIIGQRLTEIHGGNDNELNRKAFRDFILNGYKVINIETVEKKIDGTEIIILNNSIGILDNNKLKAIWGTQIDITERKKFEQELKLAKEKAEEANRIKSNFLSNMSHELRTPLIGVLGYAEILMEEFKNTTYEEMASIIFQSGNRLLETLNSILTISKIESENFAIKFSYFDLINVIKEVVAVFHSLAIKKNIQISIQCSQEDMIIYSDSKIIREILNNLVNNAVKYTEKGSVIIQATINFDLNKLFLSVTDTGIGIPEEKIEIIFEEFRQVSEGLSRSFEGVGLGLAICKKYVQLLRGNITVKSKLNQGSTFIVEIPLIK